MFEVVASFLRRQKQTKNLPNAQVNWFAQIDDRVAPNVKQYLRGLRKYALLMANASFKR